jgi:hypothetical protein
MQIAPGFTSVDWRRLNLDDNLHDDWQRAVQALRDRLWKRYVEPVDALIHNEPINPNERTVGFTVLAIDCLLVEAYACFRLGILDSSGQSRRIYTSLLSQRPRFSVYFDANRAARFYEAFRCGILHQAETPNDCLIWSIGPLWDERDDATYVNRTAFHAELKAELEEYFAELRAGPAGELRTMFRRKMDHIARL